MTNVQSGVPAQRGGRMHMPRSRGALSGLFLIALGAWGALIPFIGPYFNWAYTPDEAWTWTAARGWLEVLPGAVAAFGGLLLLMTRNRATAMFGGWLAVVAGAWFVVGQVFAGPLNIGSVGFPIADGDTKRALLEITYFYGLGAVIVFFGATALGRLSVRTARDIEYADRRAYAREPAVAATDTGYADAPRTADAPRAAEEPRHKSRFGGLFGGHHGTPATR
ncbi:hypothetical protein [Aldersonia kunmingensis]|uniref:hypothetical protein n=1 Tax=Aldersonia kunmingensis TaxID=408066 RepID=UPI00082BFA03|nr:hypothetical protein [Aldersonia kunmingensis]